MDLAYLSKTPGIGGILKSCPEDFIVEEISEKIKSNGDFSHFILKKTNWTTAKAIREVAKKLGIGIRKFGYAGNKDRTAVTTQICSVYRAEPSNLLSLKIKEIEILDAWKSKEPIKLGGLYGNRFKIKIKDLENEKNIKKIEKELNGKFPNYFGEQRFGSTRKNTHIVGELLLRKKYDEAVMEYLCNTEGENNQDSVNARKELRNSLDFKSALINFPRYLSHERTLLDWLSKSPNDYVGSLRKLPKPILLLFIHAFQSYLFNLLVSERISEGKIKKEEGEFLCGINSYGFSDIEKKGKGLLAIKIIGTDSKLNPREKNILRKFSLTQEDFKIRGIPELTSKGTYRTLFAPLKDFKYSDNIFQFELPSGCYATSAMREFIK